MERTEEYYNESRRQREETMLMADALRDNPLRTPGTGQCLTHHLI